MLEYCVHFETKKNAIRKLCDRSLYLSGFYKNHAHISKQRSKYRKQNYIICVFG